MVDIDSFISSLPKTELHIHIEGTLEPQLVFQLASKNGIQLPYTIQQAKARRSHFQNLQDFLNDYYNSCNVLLHQQDFYQLSKAYLLKAISQNIKHAQIFFDPQTHTNRGVPFQTVIKGLTRASEQLSAQISIHWILCFLRDQSQESALATIEQARPFAHLIKGVGLDSAQYGNPASKFKQAYKQAVKAGLCGPDGNFVVAHAGEEGDPVYIMDALYNLKVRRIDHGVRCLEDPYLVAFLAEAQVPLTVCPRSNLCLQVLTRYFGGQGIIKRMLEQNLLVNINSDDPAYFGGYINDNYRFILDEFRDLEEQELKETLKKLACNGFKASFISDEMKTEFINQITGL